MFFHTNLVSNRNRKYRGVFPSIYALKVNQGHRTAPNVVINLSRFRGDSCLAVIGYQRTARQIVNTPPILTSDYRMTGP